MGKRDSTNLTPAMRQYVAFKEQHPECVLFFRMGDFYEVFYDDAKLCHKALGITLTERTSGVPMAGVPYHAIENYLRRLIEQGYRVAIADQIQDAKDAKGVVDRAVTRVLTPGTLVDESLLDGSRANHVAALCFTESGEQSSACLAIAEVSTGAFEIVDVPGDSIGDELERLGVNEILYAETATGETPERVSRCTNGRSIALTGRAAWHFRHAEAFEAITKHFGVTTLSGFGLSDDDVALGAAGAMVRYLQETQATNGDSDRLRHLRPPRRRTTADYLAIDAVGLRSLEIDRTMRTGEIDGSLFGVLKKGATSMGQRLMRQWLCFPLRDIGMIETRQNAVATFVDDRTLARDLRSHLSGIQDVARMAGRMAMRRATPRDLVALGKSVAHLHDLLELLDGRTSLGVWHSALESVRGALEPLAKEILAACVDDPPGHMREGGLIRDGVDAALDEARSLQRDANDWLAQYQKQLTTETGINSLKVGYNRVFGYYIEVTAAQAANVPDTFTRKQTLKNAERYITPPLKEFETKVLSAEDRAVSREQHLFTGLCAKAAVCAGALFTFAETVATLDVLSTFAERAVAGGYVRPRVVAEPVVDIRGGRHPVLDDLLRDRFVPNDCRLGSVISDENEPETDEPNATLALITGPNMAGKSTYIRQVALLTLMAHAGSFIPAERATIGVTDRIFTRIGASDELHAGRSTFMVEMTETANLLHHATPHSLVILDEIGRGTSTLDGLSLAWAIAEELARIGSRTLFATHYHELTVMAQEIESVRNLHVTVREWAEEITFLYRILPGCTDRSYGIHVAKIAGVPTSVLTRARALLETLEVRSAHGGNDADGPQFVPSPGGQMGLFTEYVNHPALIELKSAPLETMSPLEAFDLLRRLREQTHE